MRRIIRRFIHKSIRSTGYSIVPLNRVIPRSAGPNWAEKLNIQTIIDIGSNEGQFILNISKSLPGRKIIAFEPIAGCYRKMLHNTRHLDVQAFQTGLSDTEGDATIHVSNNLVSSSLLDMKDLHQNEYPESTFVRQETIRLSRLDTIVANMSLQKNILIKVDVQGYEEKVISGGEKTFAEAAALIVESIFEPFYEGQWLFDDIYRHFTKAGFRFMGFTEQENSKRTGIPLFADSLFIREDLVHLIV